jgi:hypothetical protein
MNWTISVGAPGFKGFEHGTNAGVTTLQTRITSTPCRTGVHWSFNPSGDSNASLLHAGASRAGPSIQVWQQVLSTLVGNDD